MGLRRAIIDVPLLVRRLDELTKEDPFPSATRNLEITNPDDGGMTNENPTRNIDDRVDANHGDDSEHQVDGEGRAAGSCWYISPSFFMRMLTLFGRMSK